MLNRNSIAEWLRDGQHLPRKAQAEESASQKVRKLEREQLRRGVVQTARTIAE